MRVHGQVAPEAIEAWAHLGDLRTTEQVWRWADGAGLALADVVHMDEYTIDLVVPVAEGVVVVFDTT